VQFIFGEGYWRFDDLPKGEENGMELDSSGKLPVLNGGCCFLIIFVRIKQWMYLYGLR
jgi:hypothetical protein